MDFIAVVVLFVTFNTPRGEEMMWLPMVDLAACQDTAKKIVGLLDYKCIFITDDEPA